MRAMPRPKFRYMIAAFAGTNRDFRDYLKSLTLPPPSALITYPTINRKE